ncbi:MAG TPA: hydantoinase/oxoprolinase family protein [Spirochaetota bacterium]|nr:hydantoinase/oxoprolinase family protein [Spirochaetota bacterium]HOD16303.1 hydantoinase/oxoprolinase family protein [Spirochaetota bacterium]HPG52329.1 hydantoinase/oxoprolinase family protein [Spirochaetota bacterium]HPN13421.1 hydantoinase/oxoprolinase family protein [Spirochaetota bacterium]
MAKSDLFLGLDVGGTHTDAVLIGDKGIVAHYKAVTDHDNLFLSVRTAIEKISGEAERKNIKRLNLSTTLSTNAIVENKLEDVCVIISSGPGIDPEQFRIGRYFYPVSGSIDHRGKAVSGIDAASVARIVGEAASKKVRTFAAVTKFSTRNPDQENVIAAEAKGKSDFITLGHKLSGQLGFPRRVVTAYFNSAVWRIYNGFADAIDACLTELGILAEVNVLKADGGTMPFSLSRGVPVETILSGPAASVMGIAALCDITQDCVVLDIGGTTTDIAVFAGGVPLIEKDGISLQNYPTLVRALRTRSIGVGGDSVIRATAKGVTVGPDRKGPAMAAGGKEPALVDAMNARGIISYMDVKKSRDGIAALAKKKNMTPQKLADAAIDSAVAAIRADVNAMLEDINNRPVYTIHEMLEGAQLAPKKLYVMGGPAEAFREKLAGAFGLPVVLPKNFEVANAIGAALARTTIDIELFADTGRGELLIPNIDVRQKVASGYTLKDAERDVRIHLANHLKGLGLTVSEADTEIIESSSFNMIDGYYSAGKDIRVKCQIKPGVLKRLS